MNVSMFVSDSMCVHLCGSDRVGVSRCVHGSECVSACEFVCDCVREYDRSRSLQALSGSCLPVGREERCAGVGIELLPLEMAADASWLRLSWLNQGSVV